LKAIVAVSSTTVGGVIVVARAAAEVSGWARLRYIQVAPRSVATQ
jgi:hypothetical protein